MDKVEIWEPVVGFEGWYEVSDLGRVRSVDRVVTSTKRGPQICKGRVLRPGLGKTGYYTVALCRGGKPTSFTVHGLVADAFLGPRPAGHVVDHIDGGRTDNRVANLRFVPQHVNARNTPWRKGFHGKSGERGVYRNGKSGWMAMVVCRGKSVYLGTFPTIQAAKARRDEYEMENGLQWAHEQQAT